MLRRLVEILYEDLLERRYLSPPMLGQEHLEIVPALNLDAEQLIDPETNEPFPMYDFQPYGGEE